MMLDTHNVISVTEDVSGNEFLRTAREQIEAYGADHIRDFVAEAEATDDGRYRLVGNDGTYLAERVVLAVGFADARPDPPLPRTPNRQGAPLLPALRRLHVRRRAGVRDGGRRLGGLRRDDHAQLHRRRRPAPPRRGAGLERGDRRPAGRPPVDVVEVEIAGTTTGEDGWLESFEFEDGTVREYRGGFPMYGSEYDTELPEQLGCELTDDGTVAVDGDGRTSVEGVFAVGDVTPGHNQVPVAMGEGADAGIAVHMDLREFPRSAAELEAEGAVGADEPPALSADLREAARAFREGERAVGSAADDD